MIKRGQRVKCPAALFGFRLTAFPIYAQEGKGRALKIGNDRELAECIEDKIVNDKYSPEAALAEIAKGEKQFKTSISLRTLYRYIDNGIFLKLTNKDLPIKSKKKKHNKKVKVQKRASAGESIENRPEEVKDREIFGHWEMDTVKGQRGVTKSCMLVLTERKTRDEIIVKLKDRLPSKSSPFGMCLRISLLLFSLLPRSQLL